MGKRLLQQKSNIDTTRLYHPREALELLKELNGARFDESVEAHVHLNVDPRRADQMVRGTLMLPNGTGKTRRAGVFGVGRKGLEEGEAGAHGGGSGVPHPPSAKHRLKEIHVAVTPPCHMRE